ncbi:MAG: hypothetical protein GYB25_10750 [Rhodobacteraceae bacterium]|nr:hypothetical protein [Paracoccaceae bacterium]
MNRLRQPLAILLVAVLVLTGHSMAIARGMPMPADQIELCTGSGPVMMAVDAEGNPTGPAHICPDFSLSLLNAVAVPEVVLVRVEGRGEKIVVPEERVLRVIRGVSTVARGPPGARA